jgi:hypothetical protein
MVMEMDLVVAEVIVFLEEVLVAVVMGAQVGVVVEVVHQEVLLIAQFLMCIRLVQQGGMDRLEVLMGELVVGW